MRPESPAKYLIVNADDFGASTGINRGVVEAHRRGIVTSASLMVTGRATEDAVALSAEHPAMSIGLHWDVWGEDERSFDLDDGSAVRDELHRQLERFRSLTGRLPTHVDSHKHAHLGDRAFPVVREELGPLGIPLRGDGAFRYVGGFYAQWEWGVTDLHHVSVPFLLHLLRDEVAEGWTELGCHPGYRSPDFTSVYLDERAEEIRTLTDTRVREACGELGIRLASFADAATRTMVRG